MTETNQKPLSNALWSIAHQLEYRPSITRGHGCGRPPRRYVLVPLLASFLRQLRDHGEGGAEMGISLISAEIPAKFP